ncbi:acid protease [Pholiota conissans]|uniref:Acid protease n=1 Tax=Pholiota conissans TaxID=109636 RepID=A0A9P5ZBG3_9AGAR|nr:acid protease [Pholiota conissans]
MVLFLSFFVEPAREPWFSPLSFLDSVTVVASPGTLILMFSFCRLVLFFYLLLSRNFLLVNALPSTSQRSLSVPLSHPRYSSTSSTGFYIHGSIVQQQHINRGIKRLSFMAGRAIPSDYELLSNIWQRISLLSPAQQSAYPFQEMTTLLSQHTSAFSNFKSGSGTNHSSSYPTTRFHPEKHRARISTYQPTSHTTGLSIEAPDIGYMTEVRIGTPPTTFELLVDSGSADLWVGAVGCRSDAGGDCGNHTFLGPHKSSSYNQSKEDWAIGYVSGSVWGYLVQDVVSIADLTIKNHTFGVAYNESKDFTGNNIPFDGLLGLGKPDISQQRVPTFLQSLFQAKLIAAPIVSYKLPRLADGSNNTGEMTLGAMDPNHYYPKSLVTVKNANKFGFWSVAADAVKVGSRNMNWSNRTMVMDTGTTLIIAPKNDVDEIHKLIPGALYDGNEWTVPCNMSTAVSLIIGGKQFTILPSDVAFYPVEQGSATCMSGIGIGGVGPFYLDTEWLVGDVFLKNVYFSTNEETDEISIAKPLF